MSGETSPRASGSTSAGAYSSASQTGSAHDMGVPAGSSQTAPTSEPCQASLPSTIDPMALTTASWLTLTQVAFRISLGLSERDVARELGETRRDLEARLDMLREELKGQ